MAQIKKDKGYSLQKLAIFYWISIKHGVKIIKEIFVKEPGIKIVKPTASITPDYRVIWDPISR